MLTFLQFLNEKEKMVKVYGTQRQNFAVVRPSKPAKPAYTGLNVTHVWPVPRCGKRKAGDSLSL